MIDRTRANEIALLFELFTEAVYSNAPGTLITEEQTQAITTALLNGGVTVLELQTLDKRPYALLDYKLACLVQPIMRRYRNHGGWETLRRQIEIGTKTD